MHKPIELVLFTNQLKMVIEADNAGIDHFMIDLEQSESEARIKITGKETQEDQIEDIETLSKNTHKPIWCRINAYAEQTKQEVEEVIAKGADVILLPMVKTVVEVEDFLNIVDKRTKTGILVETTQACKIASDLASLAIDYIYVGLFDLSLSRQSDDIFEPLNDGTVETLRSIFHMQKFGVAGLTTIDSGSPIPCLELMKQIDSLDCDFTFLRNSFKKDIQGKNFSQEIKAMRQAWEQLQNANRVN